MYSILLSILVSVHSHRFLVAETGQTVAEKVYEGFPILISHACGVERYAILKEHYAEGKESAEGMAHLMERVKYTQTYEASHYVSRKVLSAK